MSGCSVQPLLCYAVCLSAVWVIFVHQAVCCCWLPPTAPYLLVWRGDLLLLPRNLEDKSLKILGRKTLALNHYYVWPQPNVQSEARVSTLDPSRSRRQRGTSALVSKWSSQEVNELWPGQERGGASSRWLQPISSGHWSRSSATPAPAQLGLCSINKTDTTLTQLRPRAEVTLTRLTHFSSHRDTVGLDHQCLCMTSRTLFRRNSSHVFESWLPFQWEKNHHQCQKTLQSTTCPTHSKLMKEETPVVWTLQISAIRGEYSPCWVSPNTTCVQCGHTRGCFYKQCTTSGREGQATTTQFPPWGNECMLCWRG